MSETPNPVNPSLWFMMSTKISKFITNFGIKHSIYGEKKS